MNIASIAKEVLKFSPTLATALGGPIAGIVTSYLASAFGVHPDDLAQTIANDPNSAIKIKQIEALHAEELAKIASSSYAIEVDDRKNARDREEKTEEETGHIDYVLSSIAIIVVVGFFILCCLNYFYKLTDDHVLIMLIGQVSSGFVMVLSYFFGSSKKDN